MDREWVVKKLQLRDARLMDLARAMRISQPRLSEMFAGQGRLTAGQAQRMAHYLGVSMEEVARRAGEKVAA